MFLNLITSASSCCVEEEKKDSKPTTSYYDQEHSEEKVSLGSISAVVTSKEEMSVLCEEMMSCIEGDGDFSSGNETEEDTSDDEEHECEVCNLPFPSERLYERHRRSTQHWGCGFCGGIFANSRQLNVHKENTNHWSDDGFEEVSNSSEEEENEERIGERDRML